MGEQITWAELAEVIKELRTEQQRLKDEGFTKLVITKDTYHFEKEQPDEVAHER